MKIHLFVFLPLALSASFSCNSDDDPVAEQPNAGIAYFGVHGEYSSDDPPQMNAKGERQCTADYAAGGRNPGLVKLIENRKMSFYADRAGTMPLAEDCEYRYAGFKADPHYFPEFKTSVWTTHELSGGPAACQAFKFVILRPPHGDGEVKHMHFRHGGAGSSVEALLAMSKGDYADADVCNPWWSVYCTKGNVHCDE